MTKGRTNYGTLVILEIVALAFVIVFSALT